MSRLGDLRVGEMPEAHKRICAEVAAWHGETVRGPFSAWVRSPELAGHMRDLLLFFRNRTSLPARLVELAILITVRFWDARYAWNAHERRALEAGLAPEVISAISAGRRPVFTHRDEWVAFDLCTQLQEGRAVGDAAYEAALEVLGERGVVELTALAGFYATVSMTVKAFDIPPAEG
jgi:4-carboxymuconolactone decarboxylase